MDGIKKVIKVTLGNDLDLLDESESSGKTPGEVQKVATATSHYGPKLILYFRIGIAGLSL